MQIWKATIAEVIVLMLVFTIGCASTSKVTYDIYSNPPGCAVFLDGRDVGATPTSVELGCKKEWVGLVHSPDGWSRSGEIHEIVCRPPEGGSFVQETQTEEISTADFPDGHVFLFSFSESQ